MRFRSSSPRLRPRPPVFAIALLVLFTGVVLAVITLRQVRSAETRRLRLLAGFAERIESTAEDYTEHLSEILATLPSDPDPGASESVIHGRLEQLDQVVYVDVQKLSAERIEALRKAHRLEPGGELPDELRFSLDASGDKGLVTYRGPLPASLPSDEAATSLAGGAPRSPAPPWQVTLALDLRPTLSRISLSNLFDSVLVADLDGKVLVQEGEPELRTSTLLPFLANPTGRRRQAPDVDGEATDARRLLETLIERSAADRPEKAREAKLQATTESLEVRIAGRRHRIFLQPITVELPRFEGDAVPRTVRWVACGLVSRDRLLTGSASSPLLLGVLFAVFPLGLILWPFLKLLLTSSRQPFTRFDSAALMLSTLLGVSLLTLLLLWLSFAFKLQRVRDDQLQALSRTVERAFWQEIEDAQATLDRMNRSVSSAVLSRPFWARGLEEWREKCRQEPASRPCPCDAAGYRVFDSVVWITASGDQRGRITLGKSSKIPNKVADRGYFQCVTGRTRTEPGVIDLPRSTHLPALGEGGEGADGPRLCLQSILSKTSRDAQAALAIAGPNDDLPVAAMTTPLWSLTRPVLAPGFQLAVLDADGQVQFHSDPARNLVENFFKAADEDRLLRSVMRARRAGHLSFTYWGRPQRAYVTPLEGSPWTLVVFRDLRSLRLRVLETLYDFLNPFLLFTVTVSLLGFLILALIPHRLLEPIWPDGACLVPYELLLLGSALLFALFGFFVALGQPDLIILSAAGLPLILLVVGASILHYAAQPTSRWRDYASSESWWRTGRWVIAGVSAAIALLAITLHLCRVPLWSSGPVAVVALLLATAWALAKAPPGSVPRQAVESEREPAPASEVIGWRERGLRGFRWLRRVAFWGALVLLCVALGVLVHWFRASPAVPITVLAVFASIVTWVCKRHQFVQAGTRQGGKKRRFAYLLMLTAVLAVTAILPTLGFFEIARSRQFELLVQEQQLGLVERLDERRRLPRLTATVDCPAEPGSEGAHRAPRLYTGVQEDYLSVFFASSYHPIVGGRRFARGSDSDSSVCDLCRNADQPSWSLASRRTRTEALDRAGLPTQRPWKVHQLIARLLASRPVPVSDPSAEPLGVDLSRFDSEQAISTRSGSVLATAVRVDHGAGEVLHIRSCLAPVASGCPPPAEPGAGTEPASAQESAPRGSTLEAASAESTSADDLGGQSDGLLQLAVLWMLGLVLPVAPLGLAYLISHQVLLVTLVRPERSGDDPGEATEQEPKADETEEPETEEATRTEAPRTLEELSGRVVGELQKEDDKPPAHAATFQRVLDLVRNVRGLPDDLPPRPQRILMITSVPDLALEPVRAEVAKATEQEPSSEPFEIVEFSELARPSLWGRAQRSGSSSPMILTHFKPEIEDVSRGEAQLRELQRILEEERRSVVIIGQAEPAGVLGETAGETAEDERPEASSMRRRWEGFLASFVIMYGRDEARRDTALLPKVLNKLRELVVGKRVALNGVLMRRISNSSDRLDLGPLRECMRHDLSEVLASPGKLTPDQRHQLALLTLIYRECGPTRHLQEIGRMLVDDVEDTSLTRDRLISRIGYLARPYYQAIWVSLATDARVVLYHMSEHGMANPKAFDHVLDLLQRGIVVRDPALRPMNVSFARFVRQAVGRSRVLAWEAETGTSAWSVLKWLLPLPLLLLGGFLYVTQRDSFSSLVGFLVALGSIAPILTNLYAYFEQAAARRAQQGKEPAADPG